MSRLKENKKCNILDWFYIIAVLFTLAVFIIVCFIVISKVNLTGVFATDADANNAIQRTRGAILNMDNMFLMVIIGMATFTVVSAYFIPSHPAFFFVGMFILVIAVIIAASFSNAWETFSNDSQLTEYSNSFPKMLYVMNHLPLFITVMGMATLTVLVIGFYRA